MTSYRTHQIPVRGGDIHVGVWEPDSTPAGTIMAVHGITANHQSWPAVVAALPEYRIIAPDLRGRGKSNHLPGPFGMPEHAKDLASIWTTLCHQDKVTMLGHSMGGFVSLVFAHMFPEFVERIILIDGGLPLEKPAGFSDEQIIQATLGPAAERLAMTFPSREAYREFWKQHPAFADGWSHWVETYVDYDLQGEEPELKPATAFDAMAGDSVELTGGGSLLAALDNLAHPTTMLRAERGMFNQPEGLYRVGLVEEWVAKLPDTRAFFVEDINHYTIVISDRGGETIAGYVRDPK